MPEPRDRQGREAAGRVFNGIATLYDQVRPGYPAAAIRELITACAVGPDSRVLEVGCGTGQLTRDLAPTNAHIRCVEPGTSLAAIARSNLADHPNVDVAVSTFEGYDGVGSDGPQGGFDLIVSATAFHWVDPVVGFPKAGALLRPGGFLALMTNAHGAGGSHTDERIAPQLEALHRRLDPEGGGWTFPSAREIHRSASEGGDIAAVWSRIERKVWKPPAVSHLFEAPVVTTYPWLATYDTRTYTAMLSSHSVYALMDEARRAEILAGVAGVVDDRLGGMVTKEYVAILAIARRSAPPAKGP